MKLLGFVAVFLFCAVAWAQDEDPQSAEDAAPQSIALTVFNIDETEFAVALYDQVNWYQAELICRSAGYTLLDIPDDLTQSSLKTLLLTQIDYDWSLYASQPLWLSGTNQGSYSQYVWQSTGQRITYNEFLINPPTNTPRCIGYNVATNYWSNHDCRDQRYFLCKKAATPTCT